MNAAIETESLTKRYGRRTALADTTMTIPAGRVVGLVGPNAGDLIVSKTVSLTADLTPSTITHFSCVNV